MIDDMLCSRPTGSDNFLQVYSPHPEYHSILGSLIYLLYCIYKGKGKVHPCTGTEVR